MSTLHTVNKTAASDALASCLRVAQDGDSLLLIEDGVYLHQQLTQLPMPQGLTLYVLEQDLIARGFSSAALPEAITAINYDGFVDLVCKHTQSVSWF